MILAAITFVLWMSLMNVVKIYQYSISDWVLNNERTSAGNIDYKFNFDFDVH